MRRRAGPSPAASPRPAARARSPPGGRGGQESGAISSPSPRTTQSIAPSACSRISRAVNEALWPPAKTKQSGSQRPRHAREVDDLGDVGQVVEREADRVGPPGFEHAAVVGLCLKTCRSSSAHVVPGPAAGLGDQLEPERLEPQVDLGVHQTSWDERAGPSWRSPIGEGNFASGTIEETSHGRNRRVDPCTCHLLCSAPTPMTNPLSLRPGDRVPDFALPGLDGKLRKFIWSFTGEPVALVAVDDLANLDVAQFTDLIDGLQERPPSCLSWSPATPSASRCSTLVEARRHGRGAAAALRSRQEVPGRAAGPGRHGPRARPAPCACA